MAPLVPGIQSKRSETGLTVRADLAIKSWFCRSLGERQPSAIVGTATETTWSIDTPNPTQILRR